MKYQFSSLKRSIFETFQNPKYSRPALNNLDHKLERYLNFKNGFFIEAGANDGYTQSNTYYLEKILGWRGILVEGIPSLYNKCKTIRKKSSVYNYALVAKNFSDSYVEMHYANLMSVVEGSLKNSKSQINHIEKGLKLQDIKQTYAIKVPAKTLESILDEFSDLPKIDFFSLDVEGYEVNVLKGLNLNKYKPRYILVEGIFFDEVNSFLESSYQLVEKLSFHDYLYQIKE